MGPGFRRETGAEVANCSFRSGYLPILVAHSASTSWFDLPVLQSLTLSLRLSARLDFEAARLSLAVYHCRLATCRDTARHPRTD